MSRTFNDFDGNAGEGCGHGRSREFALIALRVALASGSTARTFEQPVLSTLKKASITDLNLIAVLRPKNRVFPGQKGVLE